MLKRHADVFTSARGLNWAILERSEAFREVPRSGLELKKILYLYLSGVFLKEP